MKERLDILLVNKGLAASREKAKALIMSGIVYVNSQKEEKAGSLFEDTSLIEVRGETLKFVSRGGLKLDKAVNVFNLNFDGFTCLDIGASTGGFTDCMLQNGALKVYSVDVGRNQLDWKLRSDERVICMEKCNFRYVTSDEIPEKIDFAATDVSFISLTKILIPAYNLLKNDANMVCLIKPQFETTREKVGKKGVVRDKNVHVEVVEKIYSFCERIGFEVTGLDYSPIKGPEGNIEYLILLKKAGKDFIDNDEAEQYIRNEAENVLDESAEKYIREIVERSHTEHDSTKPEE
ncbi:MAG: TlyA family RNA methyltransferase [Lachnospiraceae bacterium]|nr:TlyA family RNA methyltransferase [Lachnospiraceae bacterium]